MNVGTYPSYTSRNMMHFNTNLCFGYIWRHLSSSWQTALKDVQLLTSEKKNKKRRLQTWWETEEERYVCEGPKKYRKVKDGKEKLGAWLHCLYHSKIMVEENLKLGYTPSKKKVVGGVFFVCLFFIPHHVTEVTNIKNGRLHVQKHSHRITEYVGKLLIAAHVWVVRKYVLQLLKSRMRPT